MILRPRFQINIDTKHVIAYLTILTALLSIIEYAAIQSLVCHQPDVNYEKIKCRWTSEPRAGRYTVTLKDGNSNVIMRYETTIPSITISSPELQFDDKYEVDVNGKSATVFLKCKSQNSNLIQD